MDISDPAYEVDRRDDKFSVISPTGVNVLECRDEHSARHYAVLLTAAWQSGYREGFRAGNAER